MRSIRLLTLCGAASALLSCTDNTAPTATSPGIEARHLLRYPARVKLGTLGGNVSYANGINASGTVVGSAETSAGQTLGFRWTLAGGMVALNTLPGDDGSAATDIDDQGTVLGVSVTGRYGYEGAVYHPVTWEPSGVIHPLALPFGVPTGYQTVSIAGLPNQQSQWAATAYRPSLCSAADGEAALFFSAATGVVNLRALAETSHLDPSVIGPCTYFFANAVNERGTVLGTGGYEDHWRAFLWNPTAGFRLLGAPPGSDPYNTRVLEQGFNNRDEVVGWYQTEHVGSPSTFAGGPWRWSKKNGFVFLPGGAGLGGYATGINDNGEAVGNLGGAVAWPRSGGIKPLATKSGQGSIALEINIQGLAIGWEGTGSGLDNHAILWNTTKVHVVTGNNLQGGPHVASAFEAKVNDCLGRRSTKLERALCFARN